MNHNTMMRLEAGAFTKVIYGSALTLLGLTIVSRVPYAIQLFRQMATNPNILNPIIATMTVVIAAIVGIAVVVRVSGLIRGTVTLSSYSGSGLTSFMQHSGLIFMAIGVLITACVFAAVAWTRIGAVAFIGAQFQLFLSVGLGLYELSRVMSFEQNADEA